MTPRAAALLDAALTVQRWRQGRFSGTTLVRMRRYIAHQLGCYPAWDAIEAAVARRLLAEDAGLIERRRVGRRREITIAGVSAERRAA